MSKHGGLLVSRCKECQSHSDRTNMCDIWHAYTPPNGYCHRWTGKCVEEKIEVEDDDQRNKFNRKAFEITIENYLYNGCERIRLRKPIKGGVVYDKYEYGDNELQILIEELDKVKEFVNENFKEWE